MGIGTAHDAAASRLASLLLVTLALVLRTDASRSLKQTGSVTYLISFNGNPTCVALTAAATRAGCTLDFCVAEANFATVQCPGGAVLTDASFPGLGVDLVTPDAPSFKTLVAAGDPERQALRVQTPATTAPGARRSALEGVFDDFYDGPLTGDAGEPNDWGYFYQWAPRSLGAPAAWAKGINGKCVRVGVVSGAWGSLGIDLIRKVDLNVSKSFDEYPFQSSVAEYGYLAGTYSAGIIGAEANNGAGIVGMAYGSTLIGVRAVIYAAQRKDLGGAGSDVLTLEWVDDERVNRANRTGVRSELYGNGTNISHMLNRAIAFANKNGVLIVVSAGLWPAYGLPGDLRTEKSYVTNPCENANVLCVAASAPVGVCPPSHCAQNSINWFYCPLGLDFAGADYNRLASFSSYGGGVDVTAPGGEFSNYPNPCWADDGIHTVSEGYGTLFVQGALSVSHTAALAALYIQKAAMDKGKLETELCAPGRTKTSVSAGQVKAAIVRGAVLPPGNPGEMRKIYGAGIINVPRTLGL